MSQCDHTECIIVLPSQQFDKYGLQVCDEQPADDETSTPPTADRDIY